MTMAELQLYRAVNALSVPVYDKDEKPLESGKERLVLAGQNVRLDSERAEAYLAHGSIRELTDDERAELEPAGEPEEGAEVNGNPEAGPGAQVPAVQSGQQESADTDENGKLKRPANGASKDKWVAYAQQEGLDSSGTRDEIRARAEAAEKLEAQ